MSAQYPTQFTALTSTDSNQVYDPVVLNGPALMADSAEIPGKPGNLYGTQSDNHLTTLTANTVAATPAGNPGINQHDNPHIDLWVLLIVAAIAGFLSEITQRKQRQQRSRRE